MSKLLKEALSSLCCLASAGVLSNAGSSAERVRLPNAEAEVRVTKIKKVKGANGSTKKKLFKKLGQNDVRVNGKRAEVKVNGKWHPAIRIGGGVFLVLSAGGTIWYCVFGRNSGEKEALNKEDPEKKKEKLIDSKGKKGRPEKLEKKEGKLKEKRKKLEQVAKDCGFKDKDSSLVGKLIEGLVKMKVRIASAEISKGFRVQVCNDDDSGSIICSLNLNYAKNVENEGEGLCISGGSAYPLVWLKEGTLVKHDKLMKDGHSVLYSLFDDDRGKDSREFKIVALGLVAKQIAYALTSGNMENLSKTPGAYVSNGVWGGLVFSDFFRFIRLVNCICEFEEVEVHV